jgi:hypothetical protein
MYKNAAKFDTIRSVAFGSITSSYVIVGSVLSTPAVVVAFKNTTNGLIFVSMDGVNDMIVVPAGSYCVYDLRTNAPNATDYLLSSGTPFMVKYSGHGPTSGSFYVEAIVTQTNP